MPLTAERPITIGPQEDGLSPYRPDGDEEIRLAISRLLKERRDEEWSEIIEKKLIRWGMDRDFLRDDDLVPPSEAAIAKAFEVVSFMRERDWALPTGIIPDGEGGLAFENRQGSAYQRIELDENGEMRLLSFENHRLISEYPIDPV